MNEILANETAEIKNKTNQKKNFTTKFSFVVLEFNIKRAHLLEY